MSGEKTTVFYDDKKRSAALRSAFPGAVLLFVRGLPSAADLDAAAGGTAVLALANDKLQRATDALDGRIPQRVVIVPDPAVSSAAPFEIDARKPRLDYMETEISRVCNLNCRGCCDFCNLVKGDPFYDFDGFCSDLSRMKRLFWGITKIRIMGGEPLLNPRLPEFAEKTRELFPDCDLRVVTNGLLIPSLPGETLRRLRQADCSFDISNYAPTRKKKREIVQKLKAAGIPYDFSIPMVFFFRNVLEHPAEDPAAAYSNCIFTHCHMMGDGKLAPCSFPYCIHRFNEHFGTSYPEDDYVDLYDDGITGRQVVERFSHPYAFCRCCGRGFIPIRWKGHCSAENARMEDWLIRDTFLNTRFAPAVQRAVKKGAGALRGTIQRKK